ncbi:phage major capsid protein [Burkholderia pseudomallei]|uniref:phage major capsid protein n=1 Tax=Burkholderia pseudomallei TaxID=28450 RepID=UPI00050DB4EA|nr:phage major capsid protein [Burkholderia pseudomallei]KGD55420.1 phage major capsid protein, HK97 family [Burkholderia pseudomallei]KGV49497.1 phage major capsid protein, HK97 family [Burkholderia pseudomallei BDU 2]KGW50879.1 phage major capsid protein, HK97 family [Burkholderia pseudomallei MSHR684]OMW24984.1 phage capsid protein [Burkholderia pseudomallei]
MNLAEQIKALKAKIAKALKERDAMVVKSATDGIALTDDQIGQVNAFNAEMEADQKQLDILLVTEKSLAAQAVAVPRTEGAVTVTDKSTVSVTSNAPKGSTFTRFAMLQAKAKGNLALVDSLAKSHYADDGRLQQFVKAAVTAGNTQVSAWAGSLIYPQEYTSDFIELLYPMTVLGRLGLRKVPFNVTVAGQTGGTSVGWVGEAKPAPVTRAAFNRIYLTHTKVAAISVLSDELIRFSNPAAEALVQADLLKAAAKGLDLSFLGTDAGEPNISPAGLLNDIKPTPASGTSPLNLIDDVQAVLKPYIDLNYDMSSAIFVMTPALALRISGLRNALGGKYFPNIDMNGGTLESVRVITSNNAPANSIVLLIQDEIYLSEDAAPSIDLSREASILMDDSPDGSSVTPVSMFQNGMVAIRIEQLINWQLRRKTGAAGVITKCAYKSDLVTTVQPAPAG